MCLDKIKHFINNKKGSVLALVMGFITLMVLSAVSLSSLIQRDVILIQKVSQNDQARYVAEAGINHALAKIILEKIKPDAFPGLADSIDLGSYKVEVSTIGSRYLLTSEGTANGITKTVTAEIMDTTPTALNYFSGAGNNIVIKIHTWVDAQITGDIHSNNNTDIIVQNHATLVITGDVSSTGIITEGNKYHSSDNKDKDLSINGDVSDTAVVYEGKPRITFPVFDYVQYKQDSIDSADGSYYSGNQTFNGQTFNPNNGIIYVDGDVTIQGTCTFNGGLIADNINVVGTLDQVKKLNKNIIVAKNGDILISGRLVIAEALVFAEQDIQTHEKWGATVTVNGCMLAGRDIRMWNTRTELDYNHVYIKPDSIEGGFSILSWNK